MDTICKWAYKLHVAQKYQERWLAALSIRGTNTKRMRTYLFFKVKLRNGLMLYAEECIYPWIVSWVADGNIGTATFSK